MTWNVQHAAPARSRLQAAWIGESSADVVVLTEVAAGDGGAVLAQMLAEHGFRTHTPAATAASARDYRVMTACRGGTFDVLGGVRAGHLPHRCAALRVRLHIPGNSSRGQPQLSAGPAAPPPDDVDTDDVDTDLVVLGLYVPSRGAKERRNVDKRAFQSAVAALLPDAAALASTSTPVVIAGDLNVIEPGHVPAHANFGAWEYGFYDAFPAHGFADAFRHLHPDAREYSWFGRRSGAGYRFDHLFVTRAQLPHLADCCYDHSPREAGLSDHSALTATLALPAPAPLQPHPV